MELDGSDDTAALIKKDNEELLHKTPKLVGVPQITRPRPARRVSSRRVITPVQ